MTFFKLVLTSLSDFISDCIHKDQELSEVLIEKNLEFFSSDGFNSSTFNLPLMLLSTNGIRPSSLAR